MKEPEWLSSGSQRAVVEGNGPSSEIPVADVVAGLAQNGYRKERLCQVHPLLIHETRKCAVCITRLFQGGHEPLQKGLAFLCSPDSQKAKIERAGPQERLHLFYWHRRQVMRGDKHVGKGHSRDSLGELAVHRHVRV